MLQNIQTTEKPFYADEVNFKIILNLNNKHSINKIYKFVLEYENYNKLQYNTIQNAIVNILKLILVIYGSDFSSNTKINMNWLLHTFYHYKLQKLNIEIFIKIYKKMMTLLDGNRKNDNEILNVKLKI